MNPRATSGLYTHRAAAFVVTIGLGLGLTALALPGSARATDQSAASARPAPTNLQSGNGPPAPPQAAFDACTGHSAGDACTVQLGDRSITGVCAQSPSSGLFCRPDHMPPPHGPPPEAFTACEGRSSGDACSASIHGTQVDGTCGSPPGASRLACRPDRPPPGGPPPGAD